MLALWTIYTQSVDEKLKKQCHLYCRIPVYLPEVTCSLRSSTFKDILCIAESECVQSWCVKDVWERESPYNGSMFRESLVTVEEKVAVYVIETVIS